MAKALPTSKKVTIKKIIFAKADAFGYASRGRNDNGNFLDELVNDPEVGGVLKEYMPKEKIRTYIKDGVLNAYTKERARRLLAEKPASDIIAQIYEVTSNTIQQGKGKDKGVSVCRSEDGRIFVVSEGTIMKWETALRKALELIAREPNLIIDGKTPSICLSLAVVNQDITDGEKRHISTALEAISVKARFCVG